MFMVGNWINGEGLFVFLIIFWLLLEFIQGGVFDFGFLMEVVGVFWLEMLFIIGGDVVENVGCGVFLCLVLIGGIVGGCGLGVMLGFEICCCWIFDGNWLGMGEGFLVGLKIEFEYLLD